MKARYPFAVIKEKLHARGGEIADFAIGARKVGLADELRHWVHANPGLALQPARARKRARWLNRVASRKQCLVLRIQGTR